MQLHREQNDCERGTGEGVCGCVGECGANSNKRKKCGLLNISSSMVKLRTNMAMKITNGGRREVAMMTCLQAAGG